MTGSYYRQREYDGPVDSGYLPSQRDEACREDDHRREHKEAEEEGQPETAEDPRNLDKEVGPLDLFLGRRPRHVD